MTARARYWLVVVLSLFAIATVLTLITTQAGATENVKVGICHRTASDTNPYVYIEVDEEAVPAHIGNTLPGHKPTVWKTDGTFRGVAHVAGDPKDDYLAVSDADCSDTQTPPPTTPPPTTPPPTEPPPTTPPPSGGGWSPSWTPTPPGYTPPAPASGNLPNTGLDVTDGLLLIGALMILGLSSLWFSRRRFS